MIENLKNQQFDVVVCNPPYISNEVYETLDWSVRGFEPKIALVGGDDGCFFYRKLSVELLSILPIGGLVFFEIGFDQGESVKSLFQNPSWREGVVLKDLSGHDRFYFNERVL